MTRPRIRAGGFYFSRGFAARSRASRANFAAAPLLRPARQNRHATQAKKYVSRKPWSGVRHSNKAATGGGKELDWPDRREDRYFFLSFQPILYSDWQPRARKPCAKADITSYPPVKARPNFQPKLPRIGSSNVNQRCAKATSYILKLGQPNLNFKIFSEFLTFFI